jgi:hypothetical protein
MDLGLIVDSKHNLRRINLFWCTSSSRTDTYEIKARIIQDALAVIFKVVALG